MFLCNKVASVIRILVLNLGSNANVRRKKGHIAFKYYKNIFNYSRNSKAQHMHEPAFLKSSCTIFGVSMKGVDWQIG